MALGCLFKKANKMLYLKLRTPLKSHCGRNSDFVSFSSPCSVDKLMALFPRITNPHLPALLFLKGGPGLWEGLPPRLYTLAILMFSLALRNSASERSQTLRLQMNLTFIFYFFSKAAEESNQIIFSKLEQ